ncbi:MAG: tetratricopeptide repeat protein [Alphaproteobacteria bacterium]
MRYLFALLMLGLIFQPDPVLAALTFKNVSGSPVAPTSTATYYRFFLGIALLGATVTAISYYLVRKFRPDWLKAPNAIVWLAFVFPVLFSAFAFFYTADSWGYRAQPLMRQIRDNLNIAAICWAYWLLVFSIAYIGYLFVKRKFREAKVFFFKAICIAAAVSGAFFLYPMLEFSYIKSNALAGNVDAQVRLGYIYSCYRGCQYNKTRDISTALEWFRKATQQGDVEALEMIGRLSFRDNWEDAAKKAVKSGHRHMACGLGSAYKSGKMVNGKMTHDFEEAYFWYRICKTPEAMQQADKLAKDFAPEKLEELDRKVEEWNSHPPPSE